MEGWLLVEGRRGNRLGAISIVGIMGVGMRSKGIRCLLGIGRWRLNMKGPRETAGGMAGARYSILMDYHLRVNSVKDNVAAMGNFPFNSAS